MLFICTEYEAYILSSGNLIQNGSNHIHKQIFFFISVDIFNHNEKLAVLPRQQAIEFLNQFFRSIRTENRIQNTEPVTGTVESTSKSVG